LPPGLFTLLISPTCLLFTSGEATPVAERHNLDLTTPVAVVDDRTMAGRTSRIKAAKLLHAESDPGPTTFACAHCAAAASTITMPP
jgi:hypothetical protein